MNPIENPVTNHLPANLRFLRKHFNLSQEVFAERIGLNRGNIASYENGTCQPKICNLKNISKYFQVSIGDLTGSDLRPPGAYESAVHKFNNKPVWAYEIIDTYLSKAQETEVLLESLHNTFLVTANNLEKLPRDVQFLMLNYEQMFKASKKIVDTHKDLLVYLKHKASQKASQKAES